jgi:hypothetical protein
MAVQFSDREAMEMNFNKFKRKVSCVECSRFDDESRLDGLAEMHVCFKG